LRCRRPAQAASRAGHGLHQQEASGQASAKGGLVQARPTDAREIREPRTCGAVPKRTCLKQYLVITYYQSGPHKKLEPYGIGPAIVKKPSNPWLFVLLRADRKRAIIKPQTGGFDG